MSTDTHRSKVPHHLFSILLLLTLMVRSGFAESSSDRRRHAESLTQTLQTLSARWSRARDGEKQALASQMVATGSERRDLLRLLMSEDPSEVLRLALSSSERAALPYEVQQLVERHEQAEGVLEVLCEDYHDGRSRVLRTLIARDRRIELHFGARPPDLLDGTRVRSRGVVLDDAMAIESGDTDLDVLARPRGGGTGGSTGTSGGGTSTLPNTVGEQKTLVILVNFADNPSIPYSVEEARGVAFGTTSDFFMENSGQRTWLAGEVAGWFTIAASSSVCDTALIASQARSAASEAGVDVSAYDHLVFAFPQISCGWWGLSSVGGNPSQAWITGDFELGVTAHELGHGLGLFHSHSLECATATLGASCITYEYGDTLDMMGASSFAHFNPFQKERLGWLSAGTAPTITTVEAGGSYTLDAYESTGSGPKALKVLKSTDPSTGERTWYYVHARRALGFDAALGDNVNVLNGVVIGYGAEANGNGSYLLDMTPASGSSIYYDWKDPALVAGRSFEDPAAGLTMTVDWASASGAAVSIQFGSTTTARPTVALWTDQSSYSAGQVVTITAEVTLDTAAVVGATVAFTVTKPNGSKVVGSAITGADGTARFALRLRKQDPLGVYQAVAIASWSGSSGNATDTFSVQR